MLLGLLALARFLTAIGALDAGGAFGGMGASREMTIAPLVEPVLMMVVFSTAVAAGTTELGALAAHRGTSWILAWRAADFLGFAAMLVLLPAETGRIPVDNPDTHLELTMLHEGMLLEHSGPGLGCMVLASHTRQIVTLGLVSALFFPVGPADGAGAAGLLLGAGAFAAKILVLAIYLALVESSYAKLRLFRVPQYPRRRLRVRPRGARAEDPVSAETVHTIIDDLGALLLFTMILIVAAGQIYRAIYAVAAQSLLIAIAGGVLATATGNVDLWVIAGITLAVKAIAAARGCCTGSSGA